MSNLKVEGKVADFCPKCKNCKSTTRECDGKKDWLIEVECEDPYDGMIKTLAADSDICCSMFEFANEVPVYESKKVKPIEEELKELKEKYSKHETWIDELIKASKRKDDLIQNYREKLKKANDEINLLNSKLDKLGDYYRTNEKLIDNIQKVIFPQEEGCDYTYSYDEILNKVKELKVQSDENGAMYEDLKYWKDRCHNAESDVTTLTSEVGTLNNMYNRLKEKNDKDVMHSLHLSYELNKMKSKYETECKSSSNIVEENVKLESEINDLKEKNENLTKMVERRDRWVNDLQSDVYTLQNEVLTIRDIAQKAYDDTNRD